ncbi:MAG: gephyrin-like molybdotransferase Glp [Halanaerobiales bacterium]|nr:gephyrin-like molybdotransferase Glp [Halanaerobiales bacterium]
MQNFLDLKNTSEFWAEVKENINIKKQKLEKINYENSVNRILAENLVSNENLPAFNRSTVDGYAVCASDLKGISESLPAYLDVIGSIEMGKKTDLKIKEGQAAYIPTGAMLPEGADGVIMVEYTEKISDKMIECSRSVGVGENIIKKGEEVKKDELILKKGHKIKPRDMGVLAGLGFNELEVYEKPEVVIISTGDELIPPDKEIKFGQIRDINTYTIGALLKEAGASVNKVGIIEDTYQSLKESVKNHLTSDLILVSGGSSAGIKDMTVDVINELGKPGVLIHGLKVKPGKPTILGQINETPVMGLPGHPGSAWIISNLFVKPLVKLLSGEYNIENIESNISKDSIKRKAILDRNISSDKGRKEIIPVKEVYRKENIYAKPLLGKSSFMKVFIDSDGYIVIESGLEGLNKGDQVDIIYFN